jgi:hypothetical protein
VFVVGSIVGETFGVPEAFGVAAAFGVAVAEAYGVCTKVAEVFVVCAVDLGSMLVPPNSVITG